MFGIDIQNNKGCSAVKGSQTWRSGQTEVYSNSIAELGGGHRKRVKWGGGAAQKGEGLGFPERFSR